AQVTGERFLSPRALRRGRDRGESGYRAVAVAVALGEHQRAMAAHGVAEYSGPLRVSGELGRGQVEQLARHRAFHAVMAGPGIAGRVEIKAGAGAEIPVVVLARRSCAARAGVR